ncbi:hypothetical protein [Bradyrhizobium sp. ERR14]|uniref:hypothetical protein n=1 Tax=Bradyrhizobium sp. ERR14 TaxID=2663837 RepID=UPI00160DD95D|nr:hypothetical protein [Bradyrhizobium sp. ERR14]MBB4399253.1 hypothetical protein [Bradyrhizobium sp. ERR14]
MNQVKAMAPLLAILSSGKTGRARNLQDEIASLVASLIYDGDDVLLLNGQEQLQALKQWLSEPGLVVFGIVGQSVRFRACLEYFVEDRLSDFGWKQLFQRIIEDAEREPQNARFADEPRRMLRDLPARKEKWARTGASLQ